MADKYAEELKQEARQKALEWNGEKINGKYNRPPIANWSCYEKGYLAGAEPREKRITELEQENELLKADLEFSAKTSNKNKQTVKEYQKLVDEYSSEGADLQDRIKELEKENAELKAQLESERDLPAIAYMQGAEKQKKKDEEHLTKAKEHIRTLISCLIDWVKEGDKYYCHIADAEQFLKE